MPPLTLPTAYEEGFFSLKQGKVAYRRTHVPNAPTILALHGWLDNLCSFEQLMAHCPDYSWICIDLPGHGFSYHPPEDVHSHWVDYFDTLYDLFTHLNEGPSIVLGHSLGAGLISLYAGAFPEHISKLLLIDMVGSLIIDPSKAALRLREAVLSYARLDKSRIATYPDLNAAIKARQTATPLKAEQLKSLVERNLIQTAKGMQWRTDQRLLCAPSLGLTEIEVAAVLKSIEAPILLISPEQGLVHNTPLLHERISYLKKVTLKVLPGGHHVHMEYPEVVAGLIKNFLLSS